MKTLFPLATSSWDQAEYDALNRVIASNQFSMGSEVSAFEDQFARQFGTKYAVMTNSGSSANLLIMAALRFTKNDKINISEGAEIIVPAVSWSTTYFPLQQYGLKLKFVDIDKEIEKNLNITIKKIFEVKGENYFRKIEEQTTLKKLKLNSTVISLGGGAFTNNNIRKEILKNHLSFWLNWDDKTLLNRIKNSKKRPLAISATDTELINLIKKRSNIYSKALYEIKCDNLTKIEIVKKIVEIYETN